MRSAGFSLVEMLVVAGLIAITTALAVPHLLAAVHDNRTAGAAQYLAARLHRLRTEAISRSSRVGVRFLPEGSSYSFAAYVDGNADGVRTADIARGTDPPLGAVERLPDLFAGVDFGTLPGLPPVESGATAPGADPIRIGPTNILSFAPAGTSSSGSLYVLGRDSTQYVVRVFGDTSRIRVLRFDKATRRWVSP